MCSNSIPMSAFNCGGIVSPKKTMDSIDYFINFFSAIPEDKWIVGGWHNKDKTKFCAMGHLGSDNVRGKSKEAYDLINILGTNPAHINDGKNRYYRQSHPKHRIITALMDAKNHGSAKFDKEEGNAAEVLPSYFGGIDYGKIMMGNWYLSSVEIKKEVIKEVVKEVIVEKVVEKIVYVTVDSKVRELQEETLKLN